MQGFLCRTCGTQFPPSVDPPARCPICDDERQYVGLEGQQWITMEELRRDRKNEFVEMESGVNAILTRPSFAIGQRAFLIETPGGNILWDCVSLLDDETVARIREKGGIKSIAISHPHYYSTMVEWADAFDCPVLLHEADRNWVMRPSPRIRFWSGETLPILDNLTLIRGGGHFEGGTILHAPQAADGRGALFTGDIIQVVPDRRWVSFMYSYPNLIPLSASEVTRMVAVVEMLRFDRIYGAFHPLQIHSGGKEAIRKSAERYIQHISSPVGWKSHI